MFDSNQLAHVSKANLYAVVTSYSLTRCGDPYLKQKRKNVSDLFSVK